MNLVWNRSAIRIFIVGLVLVGLLLGLRAYLGSQPWPASGERLSDEATFRIGDREFANDTTADNPIAIRAAQEVRLEGEFTAWDHPFTQTVRGRPLECKPLARSLDFLLVFRRIEFFNSQGATNYDGRTTRDVYEDGSKMRLIHRVTAPTALGLYRAQLLAFERSQAVLAMTKPEDLGKPLGIVAEALVEVIPVE